MWSLWGFLWNLNSESHPHCFAHDGKSLRRQSSSLRLCFLSFWILGQICSESIFANLPPSRKLTRRWNIQRLKMYFLYWRWACCNVMLIFMVYILKSKATKFSFCCWHQVLFWVWRFVTGQPAIINTQLHWPLFTLDGWNLFQHICCSFFVRCFVWLSFSRWWFQ